MNFNLTMNSIWQVEFVNLVNRIANRKKQFRNFSKAKQSKAKQSKAKNPIANDDQQNGTKQVFC